MRVKNAASLLVASAAVVGAVAMTPAASAATPSAPSKAKANTVEVWATDVNIRAGTNTNSEVVDTIGPGTYPANCQRKGETVTEGEYKNNWWVWLAGRDGYINAVFVKGGDNMGEVPGVPEC